MFSALISIVIIRQYYLNKVTELLAQLSTSPIATSTPGAVTDPAAINERLRQLELQRREQDISETQSIGTLIKYTFYAFWLLTITIFSNLIFNLVAPLFRDRIIYTDPSREMLEKFHRQALKELQTNSRAGLAVSFLGIAVIFTGIFLGYTGNVPLGVITASSGTIIEAVSFLFHNQTKHIRRRVEALEDTLHRIVLVEGIKNRESADEAKKLLAMSNLTQRKAETTDHGA